MQPQLPIEPRLQDAWMQAFANATSGVREAPSRFDYWLKTQHPNVREFAKKFDKEILTPPIPTIETALPLGAMVLNPKTLSKFKTLFSENLPKIAENFPNLASKSIEGLAFVKTRYPAFYEKIMKNAKVVNDLEMPQASYWNNPSSTMAIATSEPLEESAILDQIRSVMHEGRHVMQDRVPRYPRSTSELGPYPHSEADKIAKLGRQALRFGDIKGFDSAKEKYQNIPHEQDPFRSSELGANAYKLYQNLMGNLVDGTPIPLERTFRPSVPKQKPIRNWNDLYSYFGIK